MARIIFAPDSFKGSLTAPDAARAMANGWRHVFPDDDCVLLPVADGGEGTLDALLTATHGQSFEKAVTGPNGDSVRARWGLLENGQTAVVEMAQAAGLTLVPPGDHCPLHATTRGVGELLQSALSHKSVRRIIIGLGGSATNDGGAGLLQALGVRLLDANGADLPPGGAALAHLSQVVTTGVFAFPPNVEVQIACDVQNPLYGPNGASAIFGPQKGASPGDIARLDAALAHFARVLAPDTNDPNSMNLADVPGAGAAGGTAFALLWQFPGAVLVPGIDLILDAARFDTMVAGARLVVTGEGKLDAQTLSGKAVLGVAQRAKKQNVPVIALVGAIAPDVTGEQLAQAGIYAALPLCPGPMSLEKATTHAAAYLADTTERAARLFALGVSL